MKRLLCAILTLVLVIAAPMNFLAEAIDIVYYVDGYYTYCLGETAAVLVSVNTKISGNVKVPAKFDGKVLKDIGSGAFRGCNNITSITLSSGVQTIGEYAFSGCSALNSISLPSTLKTIGIQAFYDCTLKSITIPANVEELGGVFLGCNLENIYVNSKNKYFNSIDGVLTNKNKTEILLYPKCKAGETYIFPKTVTAIGSSAFLNAKNLTSLTIPTAIKTIGESAFYECINLKSVKLNSSVESIGSGIFENCRNLEDVVIENGVKTVSERAFACCDSLKNITIPSSVIKIEKNAFYHCENLTQVVIEDGVSEIGSYAFNRCINLTNITIPSSVRKICDSAFSLCDNLKNVTFNNGLEKIEGGAFKYCNSLEYVVIPESVTQIGSAAFRCCDNLKKVTIKGTIELLGSCAFADCPQLKEVIINGVKEIDNPFQGSKIETLIIKDKLEVIPSWDFDFDTSLKHLYLPATLKKIEKNAFGNDSYIVNVCFGGTKEQWESAKSSADMQLITYVIYDCPEVPSIWVRNKKVVFAMKDVAGYVEIADDVETIEGSAFKDISSVVAVSLPDGFKGIGSKGFINCSGMKRIYIPASITSIGIDAFSNCSSLKTVYYGGTKEQWETFKGSISSGNESILNAEIIFEADGLAVVCGDTNFDGQMDTADLAMTKLVLANIVKLVGKQYLSTDFDFDGKVTTVDLAQLKLKIAGIE